MTMLAVNMKKFGIETSFVDVTNPAAFAAAIRPDTRAVFAESLGNPSLVVLDIRAIAYVVHAHGVPLIIDNTLPSPLLCNPLALGEDRVFKRPFSFPMAPRTRHPPRVTRTSKGLRTVER